MARQLRVRVAKRKIAESDDEWTEQNPKLIKTEDGDDIRRVFWVLWFWTHRACTGSVLSRVGLTDSSRVPHWRNLNAIPYPIVNSMLHHLGDMDLHIFLDNFVSAATYDQLQVALRTMLSCVDDFSPLQQVKGLHVLVRRIASTPWFQVLNRWNKKMEDPNMNVTLSDLFADAGQRPGVPASSPIWRLVACRMKYEAWTMDAAAWQLGMNRKILHQREVLLLFMQDRKVTVPHWNVIPRNFRTDVDIIDSLLLDHNTTLPFENMEEMLLWIGNDDVDNEPQRRRVIEKLAPFVRHD